MDESLRCLSVCLMYLSTLFRKQTAKGIISDCKAKRRHSRDSSIHCRMNEEV